MSRERSGLIGRVGQVGIGAVFVSHDPDEARSLADRVAVMDAGRIEQVGTPRSLYEDPARWPRGSGVACRAA